MSGQPNEKAPGVGITSGPRLALTALRIAIGWHLLYEGVAKLLQRGWSSADYLSSSTWIFAKLFQWIAETAWALKTADTINVWALTVLGLCLVLGYLTAFPVFAVQRYCCFTTRRIRLLARGATFGAAREII